MASLREYFETDFPRVHNNAQSLRAESDGNAVEFPLRVHFDFDANAKFISCYLPTEVCRPPIIREVIERVDDFLPEADGLVAEMNLPGERPRSSLDLRFAGGLYVYHAAAIEESAQAELRALGKERGIAVQFRGPEFAAARTRLQKPLAFVSHDSRDKDLIARPIAVKLASMLCPVWFDEFSLKVGDRLRESIERGLKESRKCILVVTPNFLNNSGWTREEFDAVFTRELVQRTDLILPVWHEVTPEQVFEYSAALTNRKAVNWNLGVDEVVRQLRRAIGE